MADPDQKPRVFISYARKDGEEFARNLRERLVAEDIPLWQDRVGMEGGRDWWLQITEAIEQVEYMVLVMTPAAMTSLIVRKEWRYARQHGVCVYPVIAAPGLDFASQPRWMRDANFYDLDHSWPKFLNDLNTRCQTPRVPFLIEDLPAEYVLRPTEFNAILGALLDEEREEPKAGIVALKGAGGYGKTMMAIAICHDERIQQAFDDGILRVTLGENPDNLIGKVEDLIYMLSGERPGFTSVDTAAAMLAELLADRDLLIVIDDAWRASDIRPFLQGGERCARLITTRNSDILPSNTHKISVYAMQPGEAMQMLSLGLPDGDPKALADLAKRLGHWALLLKLVNGALRNRVEGGQPFADALDYVNRALAKRGLKAFDAKNAEGRSQAVARTLGVSLELLSADERARYDELAVFPEDIDVPLATLEKLWSLDDLDTEDLCSRLFGLSLLLDTNLVARTIRLHDVVRAYLRDERRERLPSLHGKLLDAHRKGERETRWADLPADEPYLWNHLAYHLVEAGRGDELVTTVKDLRYVAVKTCVRSAYAAEADLLAAETYAPDDQAVRLLRRSVANMGHILSRCQAPDEIMAALHSRLSHLDALAERCRALAQELPTPYVTAWYPLPDLPHPALIRTLTGHTTNVTACAISPDGRWIVSASADNTLKVWDAATGTERLTLSGHTNDVTACAISPDGRWIVSASADKMLKVWDAATGTERLTLSGHTSDVTACAISPDGRWIVSASADKMLKVWDAVTGTERLTLSGHTNGVVACAISPDGRWIVSASADNTLKVWDAATGTERLTLSGHIEGVNACTVSRDGRSIISASYDGTLKVWDAATGAERLTLSGHTNGVRGCAISPDGRWIVSASQDNTLKVWDAATGAERLTLSGHTNQVTACAISPDGRWIVSASADKMLKVWDAVTGTERLTLSGHTNGVVGCAISPDGRWIVSASADHTLKVWDAVTGTERLTLSGHTNGVVGCAISPDGRWIVSASADHTLKVWDAVTGTERLTLSGHAEIVTGCAISPDGRWIVSASADHTLKVWDAVTGAEGLTLSGHTADVNGCAISPDGRWIVSASADHTLKVWDTVTGAEGLTLSGHRNLVNGCAVSPDGRWIVSASADDTLKVWDTATGAERLVLNGHTEGVNACAVSPLGRWIISASADKTLKAWDANDGRCIATFHTDGEVRNCAFHPDGERIIAAGAGGLYWLRLVR